MASSFYLRIYGSFFFYPYVSLLSRYCCLLSPFLPFFLSPPRQHTHRRTKNILILRCALLLPQKPQSLGNARRIYYSSLYLPFCRRYYSLYIATPQNFPFSLYNQKWGGVDGLRWVFEASSSSSSVPSLSPPRIISFNTICCTIPTIYPSTHLFLLTYVSLLFFTMFLRTYIVRLSSSWISCSENDLLYVLDALVLVLRVTRNQKRNEIVLHCCSYNV